MWCSYQTLDVAKVKLGEVSVIIGSQQIIIQILLLVLKLIALLLPGVKEEVAVSVWLRI